MSMLLYRYPDPKVAARVAKEAKGKPSHPATKPDGSSREPGDNAGKPSDPGNGPGNVFGDEDDRVVVAGDLDRIAVDLAEPDPPRAERRPHDRRLVAPALERDTHGIRVRVIGDGGLLEPIVEWLQRHNEINHAIRTDIEANEFAISD